MTTDTLILDRAKEEIATMLEQIEREQTATQGGSTYRVSTKESELHGGQESIQITIKYSRI